MWFEFLQSFLSILPQKPINFDGLIVLSIFFLEILA